MSHLVVPVHIYILCRYFKLQVSGQQTEWVKGNNRVDDGCRVSCYTDNLYSFCKYILHFLRHAVAKVKMQLKADPKLNKYKKHTLICET